MKATDREPRTLFGKTYVWRESAAGKLCLVPLTILIDALERTFGDADA